MPTALRRSADAARGAAAYAHRLAERTGMRAREQREAAKNIYGACDGADEISPARGERFGLNGAFRYVAAR